jgi:NAD(P)-dependent dehydrogenase (short-subunit alcohol dehydrogenase family)
MAAPASPTKKFHKTTYPSLDPTRPELSAVGKTIVLTGGGTGIGAETAKYFAKAGASRIAILGRREQPLLSTKAALEAEYPSTMILAIPTDMTNKAQVDFAFEQVGTVHVLISNAAVIGSMGKIASAATDPWISGIVTNLQGNFNVATAFLAHAAKDGVIVEVNSAAAHLDITADFSSYNVAKMATARFYQCVQFEHPELSVFSIQPGAVATDMSREAGYKPQTEDEEFQWKGEGSNLLSGYDDANLPASFMVWLASPEARFLKGKYLWANWDVDELKGNKDKIESTPLLSIGLQGWPFGEV